MTKFLDFSGRFSGLPKPFRPGRPGTEFAPMAHQLTTTWASHVCVTVVEG